MRVLDPATNEWKVIHPLRTAYYSFISAVIFFLPIVTMTVAYVLIIWKLWSSKRPGEALGPELKTYDNVKKRVNLAVRYVVRRLSMLVRELDSRFDDREFDSRPPRLVL